MNSVGAQAVEKAIGDRPTAVSSEYRERPEGSMLALRWYGNQDVRVEEVAIPAITDPEDVVVKVTGSTVCGSDLHLYHREILQLQKGDILGHEWMGVVDQVGPGVSKVKKGDRVVASFQIACGKCSFCQSGLSSMCDQTNSSKLQEKMYGKPFAGLFGYSHFAGGFAGGQAEYVRCPFADVNLLKVPDAIPDEKALFLSDIIPTAYHSTVCAEVGEGKSVAIWGLGPVGLYAAKWAKLAGARRVICIDSVPERLAMAKDRLGCEIIDFTVKTDVVAAIYELEPEGVDCAIDAAAFRYTKGVLHTVQRAVGFETDSAEVVNEALRATRKFGHISLVADYAATTNGFLIGALMEKGITLRGTGQTPVQRYWPQLLAKVESGEFDPTIILSHRFPLEEFAELYAAFDRKELGIMKTFVQTRFSGPPAPGTPALSSFRKDDIKPSAVHA
ncbi:MAG: hypothetical protein M1832_004596 [Thelocarpon impressellum]|nr:MAG: hypothetical protein M1832_004596 [Thelocarpon impressellum]